MNKKKKHRKSIEPKQIPRQAETEEEGPNMSTGMTQERDNKNTAGIAHSQSSAPNSLGSQLRTRKLPDETHRQLRE